MPTPIHPAVEEFKKSKKQSYKKKPVILTQVEILLRKEIIVDCVSMK